MITYTQEEKKSVIDHVISGELSTHILADTGIPKSTFYGWLRAYREEQEADNRRTVSIRNFHLLENKVARWGTLRKEGAPGRLLYLRLISFRKRCNPCGYAVFSLLRWVRWCWKASSISSVVSSCRMPTPL